MGVVVVLVVALVVAVLSARPVVAVGVSANVALPLENPVLRLLTYGFARGGLAEVRYTTDVQATQMPRPLMVALFDAHQWARVRPATLCAALEAAHNMSTIAPLPPATAVDASALDGLAAAAWAVPPAGHVAWDVSFTGEGVLALVECPDGDADGDVADRAANDAVASWINTRTRAVNPGGRELDTETWPLPMVYSGFLLVWTIGCGAWLGATVRRIAAIRARASGPPSWWRVCLALPWMVGMVATLGLLKIVSLLAYTVYWTRYENAGERPPLGYSVAAFASAVIFYTGLCFVLGLASQGWSILMLQLPLQRALVVLAVTGFAWFGLIVANMLGASFTVVKVIAYVTIARLSFATVRETAVALSSALFEGQALFAHHENAEQAIAAWVAPLQAKYAMIREFNAKVTILAFGQLLVLMTSAILRPSLFEIVALDEAVTVGVLGYMAYLFRVGDLDYEVIGSERSRTGSESRTEPGSRSDPRPYQPGITPVQVVYPGPAPKWALGVPMMRVED